MSKTDSLARWDVPGYLDVVRVALNDGFLDVEFADGDHVSISASLFGLAISDGRSASASVNADDDGLSVQVDVADTRRVISGLDLRAASDDEFAEELRRRDTEAARRVGLRLKALREDRNVNQRDLAALVGMTAPQLSKIESGNQDLRVSTLRTLLRALGASINEISGPDAPEISRDATRRRMASAGLHAEVASRLCGVGRRDRLSSIIRSVFGWTTDDLLGAAPLPQAPLTLSVQFKARDRDAVHEQSPTVRLAHAITGAAVGAVPRAASSSLPFDPARLRDLASEPSGRVTLQTLLEFLWSCGIAVVPVDLKGPFAGAAWQVDGVTAITIAESNPSSAFWLFTLGHEVGHLALGHVATSSVVDIDDPRPNEAIDALEADANKFALDLLLPDHRQMLDQIRLGTGGNYLRFKDVVDATARRCNVSAGLLGMVAAYELTDIGQNKDRWGSATNLAKAEGDGRAITRSAFVKRVANPLGDEDATLLLDAFVLAREAS